MINPLIFRAYDIRGIAQSNETTPDLTPETVYLIGKGTGTHLRRKYNAQHMAVGRDNRLTGETLQDAFIKGITETGITVTNVGLAVSPMIYWSSCAPGLPFDCATNITASHNPPEYNGIKTVTKGAHSICGDELQEILKLILAQNFDTSDTPAPILQADIWPQYKADLLSKVSLEKPLKIVIDAGNATAGKFAPELIRELGCEVIELYCELDGTFPNHEANPEELHNMLDLIEEVKKHNADLGIGFDGDGDRVGIVDSQGKLHSSDYILLLLVQDLITRQPNPQVIFDTKFSQLIINEMEKAGAIPIMCKTGHSFIENKMKELNAPIAGEISGHLFFGENYYGFDDALLAGLKVITILSKSPTPLHQKFDHLPKVFTTPEYKLPCPDNQKFQVVEALVNHFKPLYQCTTIDGVRAKYDNNTWFAVRASNTSPNLTLRFEADTQEKLQTIKNIMLTQLQKHPSVDTSKL
ncbi:phosphomannomutase [Candidatus Peregrinibacteria bacterium HGW-Peregrinibacteria-1]|jgi:phosphomannomutase/phosphoglucomutase|nr:MAG: phosphomannomutase [Candidatus Peregrinibacteria bacterium HGW-Peregrinibacteria-1]